VLISNPLRSHTPVAYSPKTDSNKLKTIALDSFQSSSHQQLTMVDRTKLSRLAVPPKVSSEFDGFGPMDGRQVLQELRRSGIYRSVPVASLLELLKDSMDARESASQPTPVAQPSCQEPQWILAGGQIRGANDESRVATDEECREVLEARGGAKYKEDQFPGIDTTGAQEGAPSYRVDGNIHASGQPTVKALEEIFERATANGEKPVWVNLREEPVIYIDGKPHNVRLEDFENMSGSEMAERYPWVEELMEQKGVSNYSDLSVDDKRAVVERLETEEKQRILDEIDAPPEGYVLLHTEEEGDDEPQGRWVRVSPDKVKTTQEVVTDLQATHPNLEYHRLPVTDEHSPSAEVYDRLAQIGRDENSAILVNCHAGRGRTSTALAILKTVQNNEPDSDIGRLVRTLGEVHPILALGSLVAEILDSKLSMDELADRLQITDPETKEMLTHLRAQIEEARADGKDEKVKQFEQRYARLLLFGVYLRTGTEESFESWMESRGWLEDTIEALPVEGAMKKAA
jgi:inositol hexakisphosphate